MSVATITRSELRVIGYATKVVVSYLNDLELTHEIVWCEGKTKSAAYAAALAEQSRQLAITGTAKVAVLGTYPVTKPLQ